MESISTESHAPGYRAVRAFVRLLLAIFYQRIDVVGGENVPAQGAR